MLVDDAPATFVACAPLEWRAGGGNQTRRSPATVEITWIAKLDALVAAAAAAAEGATVALELSPAWFSSKQALRDAVAVARRAVPELDAAVIEGGVPRHHDVLAASGIRVVAVDDLTPVGRGNRRPAPAGWACRSVAWGLWEVRIGPGSASRRGWFSWTGLRARPAPGSLHVHRVAAGPPWADRWLAWATRHAARGGAGATLADLPEIIEGRRDGAQGRSILRAA